MFSTSGMQVSASTARPMRAPGRTSPPPLPATSAAARWFAEFLVQGHAGSAGAGAGAEAARPAARPATRRDSGAGARRRRALRPVSIQHFFTPLVRTAASWRRPRSLEVRAPRTDGDHGRRTRRRTCLQPELLDVDLRMTRSCLRPSQPRCLTIGSSTAAQVGVQRERQSADIEGRTQARSGTARGARVPPIQPAEDDPTHACRDARPGAAQAPDEDIDALIRGITISPRPALLAEVQEEVAADDPDFGRIANLIARRRAHGRAAHRQLAVLCPVAQGRAGRTISLLGLRQVAALVTGFALRQAIVGDRANLTRFWTSQASARTRVAAAGAGPAWRSADVAQSFGLFCDVGIPLLMQRFPSTRPRRSRSPTGPNRAPSPRSSRRRTRPTTRSWRADGAHLGPAAPGLRRDPPAPRLRHLPRPGGDPGVQRLVAMGLVAELSIQRFARMTEPGMEQGRRARDRPAAADRDRPRRLERNPAGGFAAKRVLSRPTGSGTRGPSSPRRAASQVGGQALSSLCVNGAAIPPMIALPRPAGRCCAPDRSLERDVQVVRVLAGELGVRRVDRRAEVGTVARRVALAKTAPRPVPAARRRFWVPARRPCPAARRTPRVGDVLLGQRAAIAHRIVGAALRPSGRR